MEIRFTHKNEKEFRFLIHGIVQRKISEKKNVRHFFVKIVFLV